MPTPGAATAGPSRNLIRAAGASGAIQDFKARNKTLGMTQRQRDLNFLWAIYRCDRYSARVYNWDGSEALSPLDAEAIAAGDTPMRASYAAPGFVTQGAGEMPLRFRRPSAPYNLVRVIVDRFTGMLFSERHHPQIRVEGDPQSEDWLSCVAEVGRLMPQFMGGRDWGGAVGTAVVGFTLIGGKPTFYCHDPRWCYPDFTNRHTLELRRLEERYYYPIEGFDPITGEPVVQDFWYRRVIDTTTDTEWPPIPVADGEEPDWDAYVPQPGEEPGEGMAKVVEHGFGFVPVVWIQNTVSRDTADGDPDCVGIYELTEEIDTLIAQANRGILANSDPSTVIDTDLDPEELGTVRKGSGRAIILKKGDGMKYLEISGTGPEAAFKAAEDLRQKALEVAQCVLEHPDVANRTATEVNRQYESMHARADRLREQYGERGIKPLLEKFIAAARILAGRNLGVVLPPKAVPDPATGVTSYVDRTLGQTPATIKLVWPPYETPNLQDVDLATRAAGMAKQAGLLDTEHAVSFVAPYYRVEDVPGMMAAIKKEQAAEQAAGQTLVGQKLEGGLFRGPGGGAGGSAA